MDLRRRTLFQLKKNLHLKKPEYNVGLKRINKMLFEDVNGRVKGFDHQEYRKFNGACIEVVKHAEHGHDGEDED